MKRLQWLAPSLIGATLIGASADEPVHETRDVLQPFNEVHVAGDFDLEITQGDTVSLSIDAPREDLLHIGTDVMDGVLTLRWEEPWSFKFWGWFSHSTPRARLSAKAIDRLTVTGSGHIHSGSWSTEALDVRISGSGTVELEALKAASLRCDVSGSGTVKLDGLRAARLSCDVAGSGHVLVAGSATHQRIRISGSGDYLAKELDSQTAYASISGSGDAELWVQRTLDAHVTGSGSVRYYGAPTLRQSVSGSGRVASLGPKESAKQN